MVAAEAAVVAVRAAVPAVVVDSEMVASEVAMASTREEAEMEAAWGAGWGWEVEAMEVAMEAVEMVEAEREAGRAAEMVGGGKAEVLVAAMAAVATVAETALAATVVAMEAAKEAETALVPTVAREVRTANSTPLSGTGMEPMGAARVLAAMVVVGRAAAARGCRADEREPEAEAMVAVVMAAVMAVG